MTTTQTLTRVLWSKGVAGPNGCLVWTAGTQRGGYGKVQIGDRHTTAHQAAYEAMIGPVPAGLELDHTCHTEDATCPGGPLCPHRKCFNPFHLEPVTPGENTRRSLTAPAAVNARREVCVNGHPFTEENTRDRKRQGGGRTCKECARDSYAERTQAPHQPPQTETCHRGHPFTPENTIQIGAVNTCRVCRRASQAEYRARRRARRAGGEK